MVEKFQINNGNKKHFEKIITFSINSSLLKAENAGEKKMI